jgi:acetolactate synthase-1/2/3 large subunit
VVTGAADGYARMAGKPACTLLHLGPGLANGVSNLHNARKAFSPVINVVGDHATYHLGFDAPLTADIEGLADDATNEQRVALIARAAELEMADAIPEDWQQDGSVRDMPATPVTFLDYTVEPRLPVPEVGQHTEEILVELGMDWDRIIELKDKKVIN